MGNHSLSALHSCLHTPLQTTRAVTADPAGTASQAWSLETMLGRLTELSRGAASAVLSLTFRLVLEAQLRDEPVCWITRRESCFFPPDAAASGVDLEALAVVRVPEARQAPRAADTLVRSGGFGLVVVDLGSVQQLPLAVQTRLSGLAHKHHAALLLLTDKTRGSPSLGSLISLHIEATRVKAAPTAADSQRFECRVHVLKDKRQGNGWQHQEAFRGPTGLC